MNGPSVCAGYHSNVSLTSTANNHSNLLSGAGRSVAPARQCITNPLVIWNLQVL